MQPLVTLTSDFGTRDPYAAAMKGAVLAACPQANVTDLTHEIAPHDVLEAALFLAATVPYFPPGTVHVAVVDPGVGGERLAVAARLAGQYVVGPDNGLLTLLLRRHRLEGARAIEAPAFRRATVAPTFHGRDIFGPAAARLACGAAFEDAGRALARLVMLDLPDPISAPGRLLGAVVHSDRFGNLTTNISLDDRQQAAVRDVRAAGHSLGGLRRTYGDVAPGEALALTGSAGFLEVAVNLGRANELLSIAVGDTVEVLLR